MKPNQPRFLPRLYPALLLSVPFLLGIATAGPSASPSSEREAYLMDLHLHGSLSEGSATMGFHTAEAERLGYDGLWWTDHMRRQMLKYYNHSMGFEGNLLQMHDERFYDEFTLEEDAAGTTSLEFRDDGPAEGTEYLRVDLQSSAGQGWTESRLRHDSLAFSHTMTLIAEPRLGIQLRLQAKTGEAAFGIRVSLSSRPDGVTKEGIPNVIEYVPVDMNPPDPPANVKRETIPPLTQGVWRDLQQLIAPDAVDNFVEQKDQALTRIELIFWAEDGDSLKIDLDDFRIDLTGPTDLELFRRQRAVLTQRYSQNVFHHVGMEIGGPFDQPIRIQTGSSDHLVGLYPSEIPFLIDYGEPSSNPDLYPASGVEAIHGQGGLAILAHMYGTLFGVMETDRDARLLANRLVKQRAWYADAIEIGYPFRERPLSDFVLVWDELSRQSVWITGVGSTDDHSVLPWDLRENRWGSWIRAETPKAVDLISAIREGQLFFGDPNVFDPAGDLVFEAQDGSYSMGDVVPVSNGPQDLRIMIQGARPGDDLVILKNGNEIGRTTFSSTMLDHSQTVGIVAGDFVRVEVRNPADEAYLLSNPIYFVDQNTVPPADRTPGG